MTSAAELRQHGWWRGPTEVHGDTMERGPDGSLCTASAVICAYGSRADGALALLKVHLGIPVGQGSLAAWNDAPERTLDQVEVALEWLDTAMHEGVTGEPSA